MSRKEVVSRRWQLFFLGFFFATALWAVFLACRDKGGASTVSAQPVPPVANGSRAGALGSGLGGDGFAPMLARVGPAVVNISATKVQRDVGGLPSNDPFFRFFFGEPSVPRERRERSLGSGVVVGRDGIILTNHHVVKDAEDITVALADKREFKAKVLGSDPKTDIAVLRVDAKELPTLPFGDSRAVRVGDLAFAVGSPFGLAQTATFGIVSAVGRGDIGIVDYEDFIQTDASINPGNSGGALVNSRGELIGINTAILSRGAQGNQGIGFAVPAHMAKAVMDAILTRGKVVRGWLGVRIQDLTPKLVKALKLASNQGALVNHIERGSPAQKAGLRLGDVITAVDGTPTSNSRRLSLRIGSSSPGSTVKLTVLRNGTSMELPLTLGELPEPGTAQANPAVPAAGPLRGVELQTLTPQIASRLNLPPVARGVVVVGIRPDSPAAQAGLRRGDVIFEVNRQPVRSVQEFEAVVSQSGGGQLLFLVGRGEMNLYIVVEP
jgi:serine protease Do